MPAAPPTRSSILIAAGLAAALVLWTWLSFTAEPLIALDLRLVAPPLDPGSATAQIAAAFALLTWPGLIYAALVGIALWAFQRRLRQLCVALLLMVVFGWGLTQLLKFTLQRTRPAHALDGADGVPPGEVRGLHVDARGVVWIGTYGGGLARVTGRTIVALRDPALAGGAISGYLNDGHGRVWLLRNRGVYVVDARALDAVANGTAAADGVVLGDVSGIPEGLGGSPAATLLPDGRAAFASADGLALIDTRACPVERTPLETSIESIDREKSFGR